jgi:hypothetical protein
VYPDPVLRYPDQYSNFMETSLDNASILILEPDRLGIRLPRARFKASGHVGAAALRETGLFVDSPGIADWVPGDMREVGEHIIVSGPGFDGHSIQTISTPGSEPVSALHSLHAAARGLRDLAAAGLLPQRLRPEGILVSSAGAVLVLPANMIDKACQPYGPAPDSIAILLAQAIRRLFQPAGAATAGDSMGSAGDSMGSAGDSAAGAGLGTTTTKPARPAAPDTAPERVPQAPLALVVPHLDPELAAAADRLADLDGWCNAFVAAASRGFIRTIAEDEQRAIASKRKAVETTLNRQAARRRFWRKRGGILSGMGIAIIVIAAIAIFDRREPGPDLSNLEPPELVAAYYQAVDSLDMELLSAAASRQAARSDDGMIANLTVLSKMRQAYETRNPLVQASEWLAAGAPPLEPGTMLFGISDLVIQATTSDSADAKSADAKSADGGAVDSGGATVRGAADTALHYEASYSLWTTGHVDDTPVITRSSRIDRLVLRRGKDGWQIVDLQRQTIAETNTPLAAGDG